MKKDVIVAIIIAIGVIGGAFLFFRNGGSADSGQTMKASTVSIVDGKQIIEIQARGGYQPRKSVARAGIPTIIRFVTNGTFDCSSSVRIPSLNVSKMLPQTGSTDIDIGVPQTANILGSCGMGMYRFEIDFQG